VARVLLRAGRRYNSITLEADAHHLMTDVWTSAGVIAGIIAVALTGWELLDPLIALAVAANIVWSGVQLMRRSALGLLDSAIPHTERDQIVAILMRYAPQGHSVSLVAHAPGRTAALSFPCMSWCPASGQCNAGTTC
jgi:cation diffusion facilitator family transporter